MDEAWIRCVCVCAEIKCGRGVTIGQPIEPTRNSRQGVKEQRSGVFEGEKRG